MRFKIIISIMYSVCNTAWANDPVQFWGSHAIESSLLGKRRFYHVYLPPSYNTLTDSFPVIYLLDGDIHRWKALSGILEGLSTASLENQVEEAIVVAIPSSENAIRKRDLTPTKLDKWVFSGKILDTYPEEVGNAAKYLAFFEQALLPHITLGQ